jgi:hypothetical protein
VADRLAAAGRAGPDEPAAAARREIPLARVEVFHPGDQFRPAPPPREYPRRQRQVVLEEVARFRVGQLRVRPELPREHPRRHGVTYSCENRTSASTKYDSPIWTVMPSGQWLPAARCAWMIFSTQFSGLGPANEVSTGGAVPAARARWYPNRPPSEMIARSTPVARRVNASTGSSSPASSASSRPKSSQVRMPTLRQFWA